MHRDQLRPGRAAHQHADTAGEGVLGQQAAEVGFGLGNHSEIGHG